MKNIYIQACKFGKGVFAARNFEEGQEVLTFQGRKITYQEACNPTLEDFCVQIGEDLYIDTESIGRYVNHSCDPSCGLKTSVTLKAIRRIQRGEEITFDYSTSMHEDHWALECLCGTDVCRGTIKDFKYLPLYLREKYIAKGIVPPWLLRELSYESSDFLPLEESLGNR